MFSPAIILASPLEEILLASTVAHGGVGVVAPLAPQAARTIDLLRADEERARRAEEDRRRFTFWAVAGIVAYWFWKRGKRRKS